MNEVAIRRFTKAILRFAALFICGTWLLASAQQAAVTVQIDAHTEGTHKSDGKTPASATKSDAANVVVWLTPLDHPIPAPSNRRPRLTQRNKTFEPHLLVVEVGTTIDFPNRDPFFHNVFSLFNGKRFDLGLYEAGATNSARFDRAGVSFLFCNIHPEMSAVVVAVNTPYFGVSDASGRASIANVPDGKYEMHVWSELTTPEELNNQTRTVTFPSSSRTLPPIHLAEAPRINTVHKNKYGQEYIAPPESTYSHP